MKRSMAIWFLLVVSVLVAGLVFVPFVDESTITEEDMQLVENFKTTTDYSVEIAADSDDDWWRWNTDSWDYHATTGTELNLWNDSGGTYMYVGQMRFEINVPKDATIDSANLTFYEEDDKGDRQMIIKRLDETNIGPLEDDTTKPVWANTSYALYEGWDSVGFEWSDPIDITDLVQEQVQLLGWSSGNYMGFHLGWNETWSSGIYDIEDYSALAINNAYIDITYTEVQYKNYDVETASDTDDDWWRYNDGVWDFHGTTFDAIQCWNGSGLIQYVGQMRFQLNVLKDATIQNANLTFYEYVDPWSTYKTIIKRINETNIGPLEQDTVKPVPTNITTAEYDGWDTVGNEWSDPIDVTALIQEQINLPYWSSGKYIGFEFTWNTTWASGVYKIEDYQNSTSSNNAYLNISYTGGIEESAYGANWLSGWGRRQQHNISQTAGTGQNYTVPMYVWNGIGSSWYDAAYVNGYAQADFDDIRFTQNNGSAALEYRVYQTWDTETTDYMSNDSEDNPAYPVNYPNAVYYNQRTYISKQGPQRDPFITYYDHENGTWGGWYGIGDNSVLHEADDSHGPPALFVDDEGYIHAFWGGHASIQRIQHSKSDSPQDISSWSLVNEIVWSSVSQTYPHVYYDATSDLLHMYVRTSTAGTQRYIEYRNSTDKGVTWSGAWHILDMSDAAPYFCAGAMDSTNTTLSIGFKRYEFGAGADDIYYLRANFSSKTVYNASGHSQGETVTDAELPNILVFNTSTASTWSPDVHLDENDYPYLMWGQEHTSGSEDGTIMFTYWTGSAWASIDNITDCWVYVAGHDFIVYDSTNITAFLSESENGNKNMTKFTWDGNTWTREAAIQQGGNRFLCYSTVPMHYTDEIQVTFGEYIPNDVNCKYYAYGSDGFVQYTWPKHALFYVRVQDDLSNDDATIYIYYSNGGVSTTENATMTTDSGNDPNHGVWGIEEEESGNNDPTNDQTPTCINPDDTDNLYAKYREYQITANVSDSDGFADLGYLEISLYSDDRETLYWTIRFDEDTATFSEQSDNSNMIRLNTTASTNSTSGNTLNVTFYIEIHWNHTDLIDTDIRQYVTDDHPVTDTDWYETNFDIETRLDFSTGPVLSDGSGTVDRGDYNTIDGIVASGVVDYYGSAISPDSTEVDVWVSCSDVEGGPWSDTTLTAGIFSVTVDSDNVVGLDTYSFIVVEKGEGVGGSDLSHMSHSDTYIADRLIVDIQADDETPFNEQQVNFALTVIYDYDDTVCSTYTIVVSRNTVWWHTFINGNKTLFNDTNSDVAYVYTTYGISESTHGLTEYSSGSESVIWSEETTTTTTTTTATTTTTETGIFYDLFLSLEMWGYLGVIGLVIIGYFLSEKDKFLGVLWFAVECLFVSQYLTLVEAMPDYWWHIFILLLGGLFTCVYPLLDR